MKTETVSTSDIVSGDTVVINGEMKTVSSRDIKNGFMGTTIFGDPFVLQGRKIERVLFTKWFQGKIIGYRAQV